MSSTYSLRFRINYQAPGDNLNTWGTTLNTGVFQLLEDAIAKRVAFALSGTKTLTTVNGATDEARCAFLDVTSGTGGTITAPSVEKLYVVRNGSAGDVILTTGGGVTATFKAGEIGWAIGDGSNFRKALITDFGGASLANITQISGLSSPTTSGQAATKGYVDATAFAMAAGSLPGQGGNAGKYLATDGAVLSWGAAPVTSVAGLTGTVSALALNAALGARLRLSADTTFYVSATGNNANDGLTALTPWLTTQYAFYYLQAHYDLAGFTATIQHAAGTYTTPFVAGGPLIGQARPNNLIIQGDAATPSNCQVTITNGTGFLAYAFGSCRVRGFKISASGTTTGQGIAISGFSGYIEYEACEFGACGVAHVFTGTGGSVYITGNYTISGSAPSHFYVSGGEIITNASTATLTGTPAFSLAFAYAKYQSQLYAVGFATSGAATGVRYLAQNGASIETNGGGGSFFPGNSAGSSATGYYS